MQHLPLLISDFAFLNLPKIPIIYDHQILSLIVNSEQNNYIQISYQNEKNILTNANVVK